MAYLQHSCVLVAVSGGWVQSKECNGTTTKIGEKRGICPTTPTCPSSFSSWPCRRPCAPSAGSPASGRTILPATWCRGATKSGRTPGPSQRRKAPPARATTENKCVNRYVVKSFSANPVAPTDKKESTKRQQKTRPMNHPKGAHLETRNLIHGPLHLGKPLVLVNVLCCPGSRRRAIGSGNSMISRRKNKPPLASNKNKHNKKERKEKYPCGAGCEGRSGRQGTYRGVERTAGPLPGLQGKRERRWREKVGGRMRCCQRGKARQARPEHHRIHQS